MIPSLIANHRNSIEQFKFWVMSLACLWDNLIIVITLGAIVPRLHTRILFSDWADRIDTLL